MKPAKHGKKFWYYLMSTPVGPTYLHTYLMTVDKADVEKAGQELLAQAEAILAKHGGGPALGVILVTGPLTLEEVTPIRDAMCALDPAIAKNMKAATTIHRTMFAAGRDQPLGKMFLDMH